MELYLYVSFAAMFIHLCMFVYYVYLASSFPQRLGDRQIYFTTAIIPLVPLTLYGLNNAKYLMNGYPIDATVLNPFFIEWCFTCPLFITNISKIMKINLSHQLILTFFTMIINILGYLSHISNIYDTKLELYSIATFIFICLSTGLIYLYKMDISNVNKNTKPGYNHITIYKTIIITLLGTWTLYPIIFIIYIQDGINHEECAISFVCMDLLSKSVFTMLLIGYQENKYRRNSMASYLVRKATRILPIETDDLTTSYDTSSTTTTIPMTIKNKEQTRPVTPAPLNENDNI